MISNSNKPSPELNEKHLWLSKVNRRNSVFSNIGLQPEHLSFWKSKCSELSI